VQVDPEHWPPVPRPCPRSVIGLALGREAHQRPWAGKGVDPVMIGLDPWVTRYSWGPHYLPGCTSPPRPSCLGGLASAGQALKDLPLVDRKQCQGMISVFSQFASSLPPRRGRTTDGVVDDVVALAGRYRAGVPWQKCRPASSPHSWSSSLVARILVS
jgi:hypothetical protein